MVNTHKSSLSYHSGHHYLNKFFRNPTDYSFFDQACDGEYLYLHIRNEGLVKVGTGKHGTVLFHVYARNSQFGTKDFRSSLVVLENKLYYFGYSTSQVDHIVVHILNTDTLEEEGHLKLFSSVHGNLFRFKC
jgi:hypothetical protein